MEIFTNAFAILMLVQYLSICVSMFIGLEGKTRFSFTKNICGVGDNPVQWCFGLLLLPGNQIKHEYWVYNNSISVSFNNVLFYSACSSFYVFNELGCKYINRIYCVRRSVVVKRSKFGSDRLKKRFLKLTIWHYIYISTVHVWVSCQLPWNREATQVTWIIPLGRPYCAGKEAGLEK